MSAQPDRNLSRKEINFVLHLMKCGAGGLLPIKVLRSARPLATTLWRIGIVDVWQRQSLHARGTEGPFVSLTGIGRERGQAFAAARQDWAGKRSAPDEIPFTH